MRSSVIRFFTAVGHDGIGIRAMIFVVITVEYRNHVEK